MSNPIVRALEEVALRVGRTLSRDAGRAVEEMYRQAGRGVQDVVKRVSEADEHSGRKLVEIAERLGRNAQQDSAADARVAERAGLRARFAQILDPKGESGRGARVSGRRDTGGQRALSGDRAAHPGGAGRHHLARRGRRLALPVGKRRALWNALRAANQIEPARALYHSSGELPPQWAVCTWLAGWYAIMDDADQGREILLAARGRWRPYMHWELLPGDVVLQPVLRTLASEELRELFLTVPIGPEAREKR